MKNFGKQQLSQSKACSCLKWGSKLLTSLIRRGHVYKSNRSVDSTLKLKLASQQHKWNKETAQELLPSKVRSTEHDNQSLKQTEQAHWKFSSLTTEVWTSVDQSLVNHDRSSGTTKCQKHKNYLTGLLYRNQRAQSKSKDKIEHQSCSLKLKLMTTELKIRSTEVQIGHNQSSANAKQSNYPTHWKDRKMTTELQFLIWHVQITDPTDGIKLEWLD